MKSLRYNPRVKSSESIPSTVYALLDERAGERFTPRVARRLATMPFEQIVAFHDSYQEWQPKLVVRALLPGELRPLVWNEFQSIGVFASGIKSPPNRDQFIRLLLTYAHGVAIPSELQAVFSHLSRFGASERLGALLETALMNYAFLREFSEGGAVEWLEEPGSYSPERLEIEDVYRLIEYEDVWSWSELDLGPSLSYANAGIAVSQAAAELVAALAYADRNVSDLVMRHPFFERVLNLMLAHALKGKRRRGGDAPRILQTLVRVGVPTLEPPKWSDILTIRDKSDRFFSWRTVLGDALTNATAIAGDEDLSGIRTLLSERLTPEAERLRREVKQSSALSSLTTGVTSFGISGIGSAVAGIVGRSPLPAMIASATTGILGGIHSHIRSRSHRQVGRALLAHYSTFTTIEP